ncbi:MAG: response regulator [Bacilli bacterium]|nr:response regulator [Bacilli bacterium]
MNNIGYLLLNGYALLILSILCLIFFLKKRLKKMEDQTYAKILVLSLITLIIGLILGIVVSNNNVPVIIQILFNKFYLAGLSVIITYFTFYTYIISSKNNDLEEKYNKINKGVFVFLITVLLIIILIPAQFSQKNMMIEGVSVYLAYGIISILYLLITYFILKNIINIKNKKYIPIILLVLEGIVSVIIQLIYPEVNYLINPSIVVNCLVMYFTVENPDVKVIEQLNIAKDQAEKANHAKTDFLSTMSHEIRTPLNAIVGFSESLKEEDLPESALDEVNDIITASKTLLDTVNGILDISKIEANKIEIINSNYDFHKIFNELVVLSKARLGEDRPIEFRYELASDTPKYLYGDYARVKQVILNFLTNAIKYTNEGYIDFRVRNITSNGICRLIITIEDSGIGIKKESIDKLFDKFERLENENSTIEGTGLGLAITKKLVELMNGKIIVQSIYGKGSQFMVIIDQKVVNVKENKEVEKSLEQEKITNDLSNKKILIVDDNMMNLKVAARLLKQYNLQIEEADSGFKCLDLINGGSSYDLILMDDMMPKMNGKETFKKLKENPSFNIPVVILTANAISGMKEQYLAEGFNDYLAKPIEKPELNRVIKKYLDK